MDLKKYTYLFAIALMLQIICGCNNGPAKATNAPEHNSVSTNSEAGNTTDEQSFRSFFADFKTAVKKRDLDAINKLTYFPIHNLHPCYLPTEGETQSTDTAGMSPAVFSKLNKQVFDDETSWLADTPADSLYLYDKKNDDKNLPLEAITDYKKPIYEYGVVYAQERTVGNKSLFFGSVKGVYKLIWIECDGNVNGH